VKADSLSFDLPVVSGGGVPDGGGNIDPVPMAGGETLELQLVGGTPSLVTAAEAVVSASDGHEHIGRLTIR
jgi:hypothetical protein